MKGGDESPDVGFGWGEVVELRACVELDEGGVLGLEPEPDKFLTHWISQGG